MSEHKLNEDNFCKLLDLLHDYSPKWSNIGLGLGFTQAELTLIASKHSLQADAPISFLRELLDQWVQWPTEKHPKDPTLDALCETLRSSIVGLGQLAEKVKREMKSTNLRKRSRDRSGEPSSPKKPVQKKMKSLDLSMEGLGTQNGNKPSSSNESDEKSLPVEDSNTRTTITTMSNSHLLSSKAMKHRFSMLQTMIRNNIKKNIDHKALAAHVSDMCILSKDHEKEVASASTIDEIFFILPKYWSFLDFSNLESIAQNYCGHDSEARKELDQYKSDVQQFCECRVSKFPEGSLNNEGLDKLVVVFDLQDPSLRHILHLKGDIADILGLPASNLVLHDIGKGSVIVTFRIATSLGKKPFIAETFTQNQKDRLLEANVISLKFKEMTIFSIPRKVKQDPPLEMAPVSNLSPEVKSILIQTPDLTTALASKPEGVAGILLGKGFISSEIMSKILADSDSYTQSEKATILIEAVKSEIELAPLKFPELLEILSEMTCAQEVVESLRSTYQSQLNQVDDDGIDEIVANKIESLENQFDDLRKRIINELDKKPEIAVDSILDTLTSLPVSLRKEYESSIADRISNMFTETQIKKLFVVHINPLTTFLDYGLIEHFIIKFGSSTLKRDMRSYHREILIFMKETTIKQLINRLPGQSKVPPNFSEMKDKIGGNPSGCTLEHINTTRKRHCSEVKLSEIVFHLVAVVELESN